MAVTASSSLVHSPNALGKVVSMATSYPDFAIDICNEPLFRSGKFVPKLYLSFLVPSVDLTDIIYDFRNRLLSYGYFFEVRYEKSDNPFTDLTKIILKICL